MRNQQTVRRTVRQKVKCAPWSPRALASVSAEMAGAPASFRARPWCCYLLVNGTNKNTYVGATVDISRRYKQHMRLLSGGARATARFATWRISMYAVLYSKNAALRFEWRAKRARGAAGRRAHFHALCAQLNVYPIDCDALRTAIHKSVKNNNV